MGGPRRYKLILEYDGTRYSGWQKQDDARTIQGSLLTAAAEIFDADTDIQGNGRTDAGVHALRYTAHIETRTSMRPDEIRLRLNDLLPHDIAVLAVEPCHPKFHARHNCIARSYHYRISRRKTAFAKKYVWWVRDHLDVSAMADAARLFEGMHDFVSFAEKQELKKSTRVLINAALLEQEEDMIFLRIVGSHFLWKMIRRMAGVLVEVGRHNLNADNIRDLLNRPSNTPARYTAPPSGLFFEQAFYDKGELQEYLSEISSKP